MSQASKRLTSPAFILGLILALSVLLRMAAALYFGDRIVEQPGIHDQVSYDALARSLLVGKGYQFDAALSPIVCAGRGKHITG